MQQKKVTDSQCQLTLKEQQCEQKKQEQECDCNWLQQCDWLCNNMETVEYCLIIIPSVLAILFLLFYFGCKRKKWCWSKPKNLELESGQLEIVSSQKNDSTISNETAKLASLTAPKIPTSIVYQFQTYLTRQIRQKSISWKKFVHVLYT